MDITTVETILDNLNIPHNRLAATIMPPSHGWLIMVPRSTVSICYDAHTNILSITANGPAEAQHCVTPVKSLNELTNLLKKIFN